VFETQIDSSWPCLDGHRLHGRAIAHGPFLSSLIVAAALKDSHFQRPEITDLNFANLLVLNDGELRTVQVTLDQAANGDASSSFFCKVFSRRPDDPGSWSLHATASVAECSEVWLPTLQEAEKMFWEARESSSHSILMSDFYESCARAGIGLAEDAQGMSELWRGDGVSFGRLQNATSRNGDDPFGSSRLLQSAVELVAAAALSEQGVPYLPVALDRLRISGEASAAVWASARLRPALSGAAVQGDAWFFTEAGKVVAQLGGLRLKNAARLEFLEPAVDQPAPVVASADVTALLKKMNAAEPNRRYLLLLDFLREQIAALLDLESGSDVPVDKGFFDLGLDSLAVIELKNRIHRAAGQAHEFPAALLFEHSTPESLAKYLASNVFYCGSAADNNSFSYRPADPIVDEVKLLPEQSLDELLNEFDEWSSTGAPK
jgi:aryl carrier-like protein